MCHSIFLTKLRLRPATLSKKKIWYRCFPVNVAKFLRTPFLAEHLRWLLLIFDYFKLGVQICRVFLTAIVEMSSIWQRRCLVSLIWHINYEIVTLNKDEVIGTVTMFGWKSVKNITARNTVISLIYWCGNYVERPSFRIVSGDSSKTMRKIYLSTKFPH